MNRFNDDFESMWNMRKAKTGTDLIVITFDILNRANIMHVHAAVLEAASPLLAYKISHAKPPNHIFNVPQIIFGDVQDIVDVPVLVAMLYGGNPHNVVAGPHPSVRCHLFARVALLASQFHCYTAFERCSEALLDINDFYQCVSRQTLQQLWQIAATHGSLSLWHRLWPAETMIV